MLKRDPFLRQNRLSPSRSGGRIRNQKTQILNINWLKSEDNYNTKYAKFIHYGQRQMKRIIFLSFIFCLLSFPVYAEIIRYVDTGSTAGGTGTTASTVADDPNRAYISLSAWEAAEQGILTDTMTVHCNRTNGGGPDGPVQFRGWTTSEAYYITVIADDFPVTGVFDSSKYVIAATNDFAIDCHENYVRFINLQIQVTETGSGTAIGIYVRNIAPGGSDLRVDSCIIKGIYSGTGFAFGIYCSDADVTMSVFNCVVYGFRGSINTEGIFGDEMTVMNVSNCTVFDCRVGIGYWPGGGSAMNVYNSAVFNNGWDFGFEIPVIDHCASDDGTGTNAQDFTAEATDWEKVFTDYTTGDVSLKNYTTSPRCVGVGTDNPGNGLYSDDIIGTVRSTTWDIGAFEYVAEAPLAVQLKGGVIIRGGVTIGE